MNCQKCNSARVMNVYSKASDLHTVSMGQNEHSGYLPYDLGIGGGDEARFDFCLNCGQIQGTWPVPLCKIEPHGETVLVGEFEDEDGDIVPFYETDAIIEDVYGSEIELTIPAWSSKRNGDTTFNTDIPSKHSQIDFEELGRIRIVANIMNAPKSRDLVIREWKV